MATTKSNIVKAENAKGMVSYKLADGKMLEQDALPPYYVYAEELRYIINKIFAGDGREVTCSVYTKYSERSSATRFSVVKNSTGGINIGCNIFSLAATRKIAAFAGFDTKAISRYFPKRGRFAVAQ